ncbi:CMD domain protein [Inquilinus limosus]|uniref:CMD domain protein n=1 Tax=Inquilinus limosus TaxID=171674 RepID=UPI0004167B95|nr:CMD domain protein [Inquilinus limosus]
MSEPTADVIDLLAGVERGSALDRIRAQRPAARENAQKSWAALFLPEDPGTVSALERHAVAAFVAALHREPAPARFYAEALAKRDSGLAAAVAVEAERAATEGPYGRYPAGPLSAEDKDGPVHHVSDESRGVLGPRLAAALEHTHLLVFRPRDASAAALQALLDAGWSTTDIVTLSQLVAFLSFQIRVVAGLRALAAA